MKNRNASVKCTFVIPDTHFQAPVNGGMVDPVYCHDPNALSLLFQVMKDRQPDEIIHSGDICEMAIVSEWNRKVEKEGLVKGEDGVWYESAWSDTMNMVKGFWEYLSKTYPRAEKHQLEGNQTLFMEANAILAKEIYKISQIRK